MTGFGVLLIILGVGSLLLPMLNMQFTVMELVDPYQPWAGILVAVIGAALVAFGLQRSRAAAEPPASTATAPTASATAAPPEPAAPAAPAGQAVPPPVEASPPDVPAATADAADTAADETRDRA
ncbi:MAG TPA: hypothetical protein VFO05_17130 [Candidatus Limnocylindrales bacterium]|nr:hypothetical protein [Candidatus Limnocylindrales bacterium]